MSSWLRLLRRLRRRFVRRSDHRHLGDLARNREDWLAAADAYRRHLAVYAGDAAIWIQLGHALKETSRFDEAAKAYRRAQELTPSDPDLLVNIGHLHKLRGDIDQAFVAYDLGALAGGTAARQELAALLNAGHWPEAVLRSVTNPALLTFLRDRATGIEPRLVSSLILCDDDWLESSDDDPWVEWRLEPVLVDAAIASLRIDLEPELGNQTARGRLYLDYGKGFEENRAIAFDVTDATRPILLALPAAIRRFRWDPVDRACRFRLRSIEVAAVANAADARALVDAAATTPMERDLAYQTVERLMSSAAGTDRSVEQLQAELPPQTDVGFAYRFWREKFVEPTAADYGRMTAMAEGFVQRPRLSIIIPVYDPPVDLLRACIDSLVAQNYPAWEICLADDCSPNPDVHALLRTLERRHPSIRVAYRSNNGHISAASNSALAMATGDYVVLVDHDDLLPPYALWVVAWTINQHPSAAILFSDEDKIDMNGYRHSPYFKGEFDPYLMYGHNMVSHLGVYRRSLVAQVGGFREGVEGSQDYDLFLRCFERIDERDIVHIPHVLYHWRTVPGSTSISEDQKSYAIVSAQAAINDHFWRTGKPIHSVDGFARGVSAIAATRLADQSVTIIIPTHDHGDLLRAAICSIRRHRTRNCDIIVVDNGSKEPATLAYLNKVESNGIAQVIASPGKFNFSALNNLAAASAQGELLCFLNNDVEVENDKWLDRARLLLSLSDIGVVGARLLYPDRHVQHFGLGLGMAEHQVAAALNLGRTEGNPGYFGKARLLQQFGAVTAACMVVRRADFQRLGGFDPELAIAYNDVDLCLRFREAGLRVVCDPQIQLIHKESRSRGADTSGERRERLDQEAAIMRARWAQALDDDPFWSPNHALDRADFALAYPPRRPMPWRLANGS